jgi:hypothetical protein
VASISSPVTSVETKMATKRRIKVKVIPRDEDDDGTDERLKPVILRRDRGWKDWLVSDYLRYWYFVGCLLADALIVLEVRANIDPGLDISVPLIILGALAVSEVLVYRYLWGSEGRWREG